MSIPVKLFRSSDANAPTLNGTAGSLIAVLDACLVNGYNLKSVQGITRVGQVATVTFATAHGFAADGLTVVRQAGFDQAEYNGDFRISNVLANSYDITVTGTPSTPGTGTATAKVAPVDWVKAFSGTNKAAYRSNAADATRLFLRVNDANPNDDSNRSALMLGYETMSDVDTGASPFPTAAQMANGIYFNKSSQGDSSARNWYLIADDRELLLFYGTYAIFPNVYRIFHFGDFASELASDPYGCLIFGDIGVGYNGDTNVGHSYYVYNTYANAETGHYLARNYTQIGTAFNCCKFAPNPRGVSDAFGYNTFNMTYPAAGNNQIYEVPVYVGENQSNQPVRGQMKCWYAPLHVRPLGHGNTLSNISGLPGRTLLAISNSVSSDPSVGEVHVDITGPWR
jgi:hypothetical protein